MTEPKVSALLATFAIGVIFLGAGWGVSVASADSTSAAAHYKDFSCFAYLAPASLWLTTTDTHSVTQTATPDGNSLTTCRFDGPAIDNTVIETGFECFTDLGITTQTRFVYTPSGHGTLTCLNDPSGH